MTEISLSMEQQFAVHSFNQRAGTLTLERAQEELVAMYEKMLKMENYYNKKLSEGWGMALGSDSQKKAL